MNSKSMAGWIGFAGILMVIIGAVDLFQGLIAIIEDEYFVLTRAGMLVVDLTTWGWFMLVLGRAPRSCRPRLARRSGVGALVWDRAHFAEHPRPARLRRRQLVPAVGVDRNHPEHRRALRADRPVDGKHGGAGDDPRVTPLPGALLMAGSDGAGHERVRKSLGMTSVEPHQHGSVAQPTLRSGPCGDARRAQAGRPADVGAGARRELDGRRVPDVEAPAYPSSAHRFLPEIAPRTLAPGDSSPVSPFGSAEPNLLSHVFPLVPAGSPQLADPRGAPRDAGLT